MDWQAIGLSLRLATSSALLLAPLGILLAWPLAFGRFRSRILLEAFTSIPLVLPPTVLGFYLIVALGPHSPLGQAWEQLTGTRLVFTFQGLLLAQVITNLPFFLQPLVASLGGVDRKLLEMASTLGSRSAGVYFRVALPLAWRGLLSGLILSFAHGIGEFGVVLMVGGNLPGRTRTASIAIFDQVQSFDLAGANRTALLLLGFALVVLACTAWLRAKERAWA
ncbi:MAG: molybdate ABC transporter permease subunit [Holophaga sp.]|jgi:molybdate transport system permease protein